MIANDRMLIKIVFLQHNYNWYALIKQLLHSMCGVINNDVH